MRNTTKNVVLHKSPHWATTMWKQACGLMFRKPGDMAMIFPLKRKQLIALHMFFVFAPIDVLVLDQQVVVAMKENFKPWTMWIAKEKGDVVIELPKETIARTKTTLGDVIEFDTIPK